ncbi:pilin [Pseudomonas lopnurensis]|uniref:pilin n=1 Tax=Pseudomonas lopnurensis TaxID=1477517 RepID=UPI0028AB452A|nr:prepilin-type N-terminal cleavage/methylation domain-containing protein [Pseudomonas lopnurensis]
MKKQQSGFTMIELIMVIVILGILAAFALPRFADFGADARESTVQGIAGSLRSASAIAHAAQLAAGGSGTDPVTLENVQITMVGGYPTADAAGIVRAAQVDGVDISTGSADPGEPITFTPNGGGASCQVTYTAADPSATAGSTARAASVTVSNPLNCD